MLGDRINDAPVLAATYIGIAVVSANHISIQVLDVLLTTKRLHASSFAKTHFQRTKND